MGGFYGSVQVRTQDRDQVREAVERVAATRGIKCLLGPTVREWVGVYPENNGQDETVGEEIARQLRCDVLHLLVHDDDVMAYCLWREGEPVDRYWSAPGYFGEEQRAEQEALTGRPEAFRHLLPEGTEPLRDLLERGSRFAFEYERLERFADLLGIANATTAYEYLKDGETDGITGWREFQELPADAIAREKQSARERRKQVNALKKQLKSSGLLLVETTRKEQLPRVCSLEQGFAVAWSVHGWGDSKPEVELHTAPWKQAEVLSTDLTSQVNDMAADGRGLSFAAAVGVGVVVCRPPEWRVEQEWKESDWAIAVAMSHDGRFVAHASRGEVVVTEADTGTRRRVLSEQASRAMAFHPSGQYLVVVRQDGSVRMYDLDSRAEGHWRQVTIGATESVSLEHVIAQLPPLDPAELEQQRAELESALQKQIDSWAKEYESAVSEKVIERMREEMEKSLKTMVDKLEAPRSGPAARQRIVRESPTAVAFTSDGRWLCCGTDKGVRVYSWAAVAAGDGEVMPSPQWRYDIETSRDGMPQAYIYAIVPEANGHGVLFGGLTGELFRMDLDTGDVRRLLTMPGQASIVYMAMSRDGQTIGIISRPQLLDAGGRSNEQQFFWSVWSYTGLLAGAAGE